VVITKAIGFDEIWNNIEHESQYIKMIKLAEDLIVKYISNNENFISNFNSIFNSIEEMIIDYKNNNIDSII
jgi:hypothetical protein